MSEKPSAQSALELQQMADELARQAQEMATKAAKVRQAEAEALRPKMPLILEGRQFWAVVSFSKYQSGREYHYAAIGWREGRSIRWAVTGQESRRFNWSGLLEFIGAANWHTVRRMHEGEALGPNIEPPVAERMGAFGRVEGVDVVTPLVQARPGPDGGYASGGVMRDW